MQRWNHLPEVHVADPTLKMRIIKVDPDPEVIRLMREEMERVKKSRNIFARIFGGIKKSSHLCIPK